MSGGPVTGGEGTPYDGLYGEAFLERRIFFRLQVYERLGILLVEVYKRGGVICHLGLRKGLKGLTEEFYGFIKSSKRSIFVIDSPGRSLRFYYHLLFYHWLLNRLFKLAQSIPNGKLSVLT